MPVLLLNLGIKTFDADDRIGEVIARLHVIHTKEPTETSDSSEPQERIMIVGNASGNNAKIFIGGQTYPTDFAPNQLKTENLPSTQQYMVSCAPGRQPAVTCRADAIVIWTGTGFQVAYA